MFKKFHIHTDSVDPVGGVPAPATPNEDGVSCSSVFAKFRRLKCYIQKNYF
jgi:hypothetical protein